MSLSGDPIMTIGDLKMFLRLVKEAGDVPDEVLVKASVSFRGQLKELSAEWDEHKVVPAGESP